MTSARASFSATPQYTCIFHDGIYFSQRAECTECGRPVALSSLSYPREIAGFRVLEKIGQGYNGHVLSVLNTESGQVSALKLTPAWFDDSRDRGGRARDEFGTPEAFAALRAVRGVPEVRDSGLAKVRVAGAELELIWTELELVRGIGLHEILERERVMATATAARVARQLADLAVDLTSSGVYHNDLYIGNIMLTSDDVKAVDLDFVAPFRLDVQASTDPRVTEPSDQEWLAHHIEAVWHATGPSGVRHADIVRAAAELLRTGSPELARQILAELPSSPLPPDPLPPGRASP